MPKPIKKSKTPAKKKPAPKVPKTRAEISKGQRERKIAKMGIVAFRKVENDARKIRLVNAATRASIQQGTFSPPALYQFPNSDGNPLTGAPSPSSFPPGNSNIATLPFQSPNPNPNNFQIDASPAPSAQASFSAHGGHIMAPATQGPAPTSTATPFRAPGGNPFVGQFGNPFVGQFGNPLVGQFGNLQFAGAYPSSATSCPFGSPIGSPGGNPLHTANPFRLFAPTPPPQATAMAPPSTAPQVFPARELLTTAPYAAAALPATPAMAPQATRVPLTPAEIQLLGEMRSSVLQLGETFEKDRASDREQIQSHVVRGEQLLRDHGGRGEQLLRDHAIRGEQLLRDHAVRGERQSAAITDALNLLVVTTTQLMLGEGFPAQNPLPMAQAPASTDPSSAAAAPTPTAGPKTTGLEIDYDDL